MCRTSRTRSWRSPGPVLGFTSAPRGRLRHSNRRCLTPLGDVSRLTTRPKRPPRTAKRRRVGTESDQRFSPRPAQQRPSWPAALLENGIEDEKASAGVRPDFGRRRTSEVHALRRTKLVCPGASRSTRLSPSDTGSPRSNVVCFGTRRRDLDGEFDPGSGRTLAACLIHASRADQRGACSSAVSGGRVSNTWATCPADRDNSGKPVLIPNSLRPLLRLHGKTVSAVTAGWARGALASWWGNGPPRRRCVADLRG